MPKDANDADWVLNDAQNMLNALGSKAWTCGVVMHNYYSLSFFDMLPFYLTFCSSIFPSLIQVFVPASMKVPMVLRYIIPWA